MRSQCQYRFGDRLRPARMITGSSIIRHNLGNLFSQCISFIGKTLLFWPHPALFFGCAPCADVARFPWYYRPFTRFQIPQAIQNGQISCSTVAPVPSRRCRPFRLPQTSTSARLPQLLRPPKTRVRMQLFGQKTVPAYVSHFLFAQGSGGFLSETNYREVVRFFWRDKRQNFEKI